MVFNEFQDLKASNGSRDSLDSKVVPKIANVFRESMEPFGTPGFPRPPNSVWRGSDCFRMHVSVQEPLQYVHPLNRDPSDSFVFLNFTSFSKCVEHGFIAISQIVLLLPWLWVRIDCYF